MPKLSKGDQVFAENIPKKQVQGWLEDGVEIHRCRPNDTAKLRKELGLEKTDEIDATLIWQLMKNHPEKFRRYEGDPVITTMYRMF